VIFKDGMLAHISCTNHTSPFPLFPLLPVVAAVGCVCCCCWLCRWCRGPVALLASVVWSVLSSSSLFGSASCWLFCYPGLLLSSLPRRDQFSSQLPLHLVSPPLSSWCVASLSLFLSRLLSLLCPWGCFLFPLLFPRCCAGCLAFVLLFHLARPVCLLVLVVGCCFCSLSLSLLLATTRRFVVRWCESDSPNLQFLG
jgi:hypothetical protein